MRVVEDGKTTVQATDGSLLGTFFASGFDGVTAIRWVRLEL